MPFIREGKTNLKYILIVVILAAIVGGGILAYQYLWLPKEKTKMLEEISLEYVLAEGEFGPPSRLLISQNGRVTYIDHLNKEHSTNLSTQEMNDLKFLIRKADFFSLKDRYEYNKGFCVSCGGSKLTVIRDAQQKTILISYVPMGEYPAIPSGLKLLDDRLQSIIQKIMVKVPEEE